MKAGGRRQLVIPSNLAYGEGALVFVIDLLEIEEPEPSSKEGERSKPKVEVQKGPPPKEVVVEDIEEGSGDAVGPNTKQVVVNYVGVNYKTGKEFESTWDEGQPRTFAFEELIPGWQQGIKGMKVGGRRELLIPSELAFKEGAVVYVLDLLEVK
jgi:peptidylprolyl isomerase